MDPIILNYSMFYKAIVSQLFKVCIHLCFAYTFPFLLGDISEIRHLAFYRDSVLYYGSTNNVVIQNISKPENITKFDTTTQPHRIFFDENLLVILNRETADIYKRGQLHKSLEILRILDASDQLLCVDFHREEIIYAHRQGKLALHNVLKNEDATFSGGMLQLKFLSDSFNHCKYSLN